MLNATWDAIRSVLGLGAEELSPSQMAARAVVTFAALVAMVRFGDKRMLNRGTAFDTIVMIMIGSVMSRAINGSTPLLGTWIAGAVLIGLHWLLAFLAYRIGWFGPLVKGNPVLLVEDGQIRKDAARGSHVTRNDLDQAIRAQGNEPDMAQVDHAYLERDGSISIIPREKGPKVLEVAVADGVQTVRIAVD